MSEDSDQPLFDNLSEATKPEETKAELIARLMTIKPLGGRAVELLTKAYPNMEENWQTAYDRWAEDYQKYCAIAFDAQVETETEKLNET